MMIQKNWYRTDQMETGRGKQMTQTCQQFWSVTETTKALIQFLIAWMKSKLRIQKFQRAPSFSFSPKLRLSSLSSVMLSIWPWSISTILWKSLFVMLDINRDVFQKTTGVGLTNQFKSSVTQMSYQMKLIKEKANRLYGFC